MKGWVAGAVCAALALAAPAGALDSVTGSYVGKIKCGALENGTTAKLKGETTIHVFEEVDGSIRMQIFAAPLLTTAEMAGFLAEDTAKTERGRFVGVECSLSYANSVGAAFHGELVIKSGGGKATLKGTFIDVSEPTGRAALCTVSAKRTSTTGPSFPICL